MTNVIKNPSTHLDGYERLREADFLVGKYGGLNVASLEENYQACKARAKSGQKQIWVVSAVRSEDKKYEHLRHPALVGKKGEEGFNTTSHLIEIGNIVNKLNEKWKKIEGFKLRPDKYSKDDIALLESRFAEVSELVFRDIKAIVDTIAMVTHDIVISEIKNNCPLDPKKKSILIKNIEKLIEDFLLDANNSTSFLGRVKHFLSFKDPQRIFRHGKDWVIIESHSENDATKEEFFSITGAGEKLAELINYHYFSFRGEGELKIGAVDSSEFDRAVYQSGDGFDKHNRELNQRKSEVTIQKRNQIRGRNMIESVNTMRVLLRDEIHRAFGGEGVDILFAGGRLPVLSGSRGYSEIIQALFSQASVEWLRLEELRGNVVGLIEKEKAIMSGDPKKNSGADPIHLMSYGMAQEVFDTTRGAGAKAVNSDALKMWQKYGIDIVVKGREHVTLITDLENGSSGVELIDYRNVPTVLQINSGYIQKQDFSSVIAEYLGEKGTTVDRMVNSAGTATFILNKELPISNEHLSGFLKGLKTRLRKKYGLDHFDLKHDVSVQRNTSLVFCLGNNIDQVGQLLKAALAFYLNGTNIELVSQGTNKNVMAFLVKRDEASSDAQKLHDVFVSNPKKYNDLLTVLKELDNYPKLIAWLAELVNLKSKIRRRLKGIID